MIETTININNEILELVSITAKKTGLSRTRIITNLLKQVMNDNWKKIPTSCSIKYQNKDPKQNWHKFHIRIREDDYEYFLDLRKLLKKSVSYILAYAVREYISEIRKGKLTDNYLYRNYVIVKEIIDNIICWKFFWGLPPNLKDHIPTFK
ncbi:hypothetical protein ACFL20_13250 [Spirochaetota bacterium]